MADALKMRAYALVAFLIILALALSLSACQTAPPTRVETVEVKIPVAVQPITPAQVPAVPPPLGKRPPTLQQQADTLLAGWCNMVAYALKANPLLRISAGEKPLDLPEYPECKDQKGN
jgi:hypothetical protein